MPQLRVQASPNSGLRLHRLTAGLRLQDLSRATGISAATLGRIERRERAAKPAEAENLADLLGTTTGDLFATDGLVREALPKAPGYTMFREVRRSLRDLKHLRDDRNRAARSAKNHATLGDEAAAARARDRAVQLNKRFRHDAAAIKRDFLAVAGHVEGAVEDLEKAWRL